MGFIGGYEPNHGKKTGSVVPAVSKNLSSVKCTRPNLPAVFFSSAFGIVLCWPRVYMLPEYPSLSLIIHEGKSWSKYHCHLRNERRELQVQAFAWACGLQHKMCSLWPVQLVLSRAARLEKAVKQSCFTRIPVIHCGVSFTYTCPIAWQGGGLSWPDNNVWQSYFPDGSSHFTVR